MNRAAPPATADARKPALLAAMAEVRRRTLALLARTPEAYLKVRVHDFYSPIGWHFGHIGMTEEYWTVCRASGGSPSDGGLSFLFANLPENPKDDRVHLPSRSCIVEYLNSTREAAEAALAGANLHAMDALIRDGYAWEFALQHECQHQETIAEMLQLIRKQDSIREEPPHYPPFAPAEETRMMRIPGGTFKMGSDAPHGYDNEKREHEACVEDFALDRMPVSAAQWARFIRQDGYGRKELWSRDGWAWRERESVSLPEYWVTCGEGFGYIGCDGVRPIHDDEPVTSVSWYEADAYSRWIDKRLPTEAEWEYAAAWEPAVRRANRFPWGDGDPDDELAVFGQNHRGPQPTGGRRSGASAFDLLDMAGNAWEWTASQFLPYPGFEPFPYDGYSKEHMDGSHYVCRGGSWATAGPILRCSFRNWYPPGYRQGFLGLRCAL